MKLWTDTGSLVLWVTVPCGEDGEEEGGKESSGISHSSPKHDVGSTCSFP